MDQFVVLLSNSDRKVSVMGTKTGRTFKSEASAERAGKRYLKDHPYHNALVLVVEPEPERVT